MERIFYPVGHGAFYIENILGKNIIFDCGTVSKRIFLEESIDRFIENYGKTVDLLIISHFDIDHYNGIKKLLKKQVKVKRILIPDLNCDLSIVNSIENFDSIEKDIPYDEKIKILKFMMNPEQTLESNFKNSKIIKVSQIDLESKKNELNSKIIDFQNLEKNIESGTEIRIGTCNSPYLKEWIIKPFSLKQSIQDIGNLLLEINNEFQLGILEEDLTSEEVLRNIWKKLDQDKSGEILEKIISIFKNKDKSNKNEYSLCVYSGLIEDRVSTKIGCLYTGDYNLKLSKNMQILEKVYKEVLKNIGIVQVPHHGSEENYNDDLIFENVKVAIISVGSKYGLPAKSVMEKIAAKCYLKIVNKDRESIYIKKFIRI
ncbi:MAG: MBL fold metallo-hydrolase [Cetobacterium sp.]